MPSEKCDEQRFGHGRVTLFILCAVLGLYQAADITTHTCGLIVVALADCRMETAQQKHWQMTLEHDTIDFCGMSRGLRNAAAAIPTGMCRSK